MFVECEYLARGLEVDYVNSLPDHMHEAAKSWRMLLQIDSDPELKMNWWDSGPFYIFIREEDARAYGRERPQSLVEFAAVDVGGTVGSVSVEVSADGVERQRRRHRGQRGHGAKHENGDDHESA